jgi:RNA polymerase sigma factor for flagellar operon FliA
MHGDRQFVEEHEGFVRNIAAKTREQLSLPCEIDDLVGFGYRGLLEARERFDPSQGVQFKTYAYYRVRGAMIDGVRKMVDVPRRAFARMRAARALDTECESAGQIRAAVERTRTDLYASLQAVDSILSRVVTAYSLGGVLELENTDPDTPEDLAMAGERKEAVRGALERLPERERLLLRGVYLEDRTIDEVARQLGISKSWASRVHGKALDMLRNQIEPPDERRG